MFYPLCIISASLIKIVAVGSASNLAQEAADVVLMTNNLTQLLVALHLAVKVNGFDDGVYWWLTRLYSGQSANPVESRVGIPMELPYYSYCCWSVLSAQFHASCCFRWVKRDLLHFPCDLVVGAFEDLPRSEVYQNLRRRALIV